MSSILTSVRECSYTIEPSICNCFDSQISVEHYYTVLAFLGKIRVDTINLISYLKIAMYIGIIALAYPI